MWLEGTYFKAVPWYTFTPSALPCRSTAQREKRKRETGGWGKEGRRHERESCVSQATQNEKDDDEMSSLYNSDWQSETVVDRSISRIRDNSERTVVDRRYEKSNKLANQGSKLENPVSVLFPAAQNP
jgi:hypothetical protein